MRSRLVVGCMTGTSLDGLDVTLVRILGSGLAMRAEMLAHGGRPFDAAASFAAPWRALAAGGTLDAEQITNASREFSLFHAEVIREVLGRAGAPRPDLISVHGQTVFHAPPSSWQIFNPWPLARALGARVVFDLRGADLAAGGQGAPITPIADWVIFRRDEPVTVVNLGGFCNITRVPAKNAADVLPLIDARDVCACNQVIDGVARAVLGRPYDPEGRAASSGTPCPAAVDDLVAILGAQSASRRSLGTGDEAGEWISRWRERVGNDLVRSAVEGVARVVARACAGGGRLLLAGGGANNKALVSSIAALHDGRVGTTAEAGVPVEHREAAAMAVLGALCEDRVPITLPQVTGVPAPAPVAGCWVHP